MSTITERLRAKEKVIALAEDIKASPVNYKTYQRSVDWGKAKRQGKRVGHMVTGSMGGAAQGVIKYDRVDMSEYEEDFEEGQHKLISNPVEYIRGRQFGLNHVEAIMYNILRYTGKI